jgi:2-polyprenyl-3-methyl-5-hydroxy-6-metoxy-1,4-benzoquinol methylase
MSNEELLVMDRSPDWNEAWSGVEQFVPLGENNMFTNFLDLYVPQAESADSKTAIEIGCFPGRFIEYISSKGYEANGIDIVANTGEISRWLKERGRRVGGFERVTLQEYVKNNQTFDLVCSFGFIEHFKNFCDILYSHAKLCKLGGRLIVGAPNFASPLQRALHKALDSCNLADHVLSSMYPKLWGIFLSALGFEIERCGSLGRFGFWNGPESLSPHFERLLGKIGTMAPHLEQFSDNFNYRESSYSVIIADKRHEAEGVFGDWNTLSEYCLSVADDLSISDEDRSIKFTSVIEYVCES